MHAVQGLFLSLTSHGGVASMANWAVTQLQLGMRPPHKLAAVLIRFVRQSRQGCTRVTKKTMKKPSATFGTGGPRVVSSRQLLNRHFRRFWAASHVTHAVMYTITDSSGASSSCGMTPHSG